MNYQQSLECVKNNFLSGQKYQLNKMELLNELMDYPHKGLSIIHITGTNGKGSVCCFIESILRESGLKTGLFTSPHLVKYNERIRINGVPLSDEEFAESVEEILPFFEQAKEKMDGDPPSFFEIFTGMGLMTFKRNCCDVVIMEAGLGGKLDATNIVNPVLSVITQVREDHLKSLGPDLMDIAEHKSGIIKYKAPLICGETRIEIKDYLKKVCKEKQADYIDANQGISISRVCISLEGISFQLKTPMRNYESIEMAMTGEYQIENAVLAIRAVEKLFPEISVSTVKQGLKKAMWAGRLHRIKLSDGTSVVLDGAHNLHGIGKLQEFLFQINTKPLIIIFGVLRDKNVEQVSQLILEIAEELIITVPPSPRAAEPEWILNCAEKTTVPALIISDPEQALDYGKKIAKEKNGILLICGSLYLVGEMMKILRNRGEDI